MLIGQIDNRSLGLGVRQPIGNRYVSDITVILLRLQCTVTHAYPHRHTHTHRSELTLTIQSSGKIGSLQRAGKRRKRA